MSSTRERQFAPKESKAAMMTAGVEAAERALQSVRDGGRKWLSQRRPDEPESA